MPLDPPVQQVIERMIAARAAAAPVATVDLDERRRAADTTMLLAGTPRAAGVEATDHTVAVDGAAITVRVLRPAGLAAPAPTLFFVHGGGWFQGDIDTAEVECGPMVSAVPCVVALVGYRLAPEHPFPIPLRDCVAAYRWLLDNAADLGVDPARIAVGGTSAGGNLAAALCLVVRDEGLAAPLLQLLDAPALDLRPRTSDSALDVGLTAAGVDEYTAFYLGSDGDPTDPLASPLLADLTGLPPAVLLVAEFDPVRDEGERYLTRLHEAGVPAAAFRVLSHLHGGWIIPVSATFTLVRELRAAALRHAFAGTLVPGLER